MRSVLWNIMTCNPLKVIPTSLLIAYFTLVLVDLLCKPDVGGDLFLQNVLRLSTDCTVLYPRN
jgi:hypothetical protein